MESQHFTRCNSRPVTLFLFPFAGGNSYSYTSLQKSFCSKVRAVSIDLPGRGRRMNEPLLQHIDEVVEDLYWSIKSQLQLPYAFFGHSMGALVSFLLTKRIVEEDLPAPVHLFVSGRGGPSGDMEREQYHLLPTSKFIDKLRELGGCPDEILDSIDIFSVFEPVLRADFKVVESYHHRSSEKLSIPVDVFYGSGEGLEEQAINLWQNETQQRVFFHPFEGNHFFIYPHAKKIASIISHKLCTDEPANVFAPQRSY